MFPTASSAHNDEHFSGSSRQRLFARFVCVLIWLRAHTRHTTRAGRDEEEKNEMKRRRIEDCMQTRLASVSLFHVVDVDSLLISQNKEVTSTATTHSVMQMCPQRVCYKLTTSSSTLRRCEFVGRWLRVLSSSSIESSVVWRSPEKFYGASARMGFRTKSNELDKNGNFAYKFGPHGIE